MNKKIWCLGAISGAAVALALSVGGYAIAAGESQSAPMAQQIQNAKTRADHEALAATYQQEAMELQQKADKHKEMAVAYSKIGFLEEKHGLVTHCNQLAKKYAEAAKEASEMAALERSLADKAK